MDHENVKQQSKQKKNKKNQSFEEFKQSSLPIFKYKHEILNKIKNNDIFLLSGDTGCGKTTGIPIMIFEEFIKKKNRLPKILITQPRKIAAIQLANYVNQLIMTSPTILNNIDKISGTKKILDDRNFVGYNVRFQKTANSKTSIIFATDGLFIREITTDIISKSVGECIKYDYIIIDEVHERSSRIDLILGFIKIITNMIDQRGCKIIIMSATMNITKISQFLSDNIFQSLEFNPIKFEHMTVPGKLYPISTFNVSEPVSDVLSAACSVIFKILCLTASGDILVFLSGVEQINSLYAQLKFKISEVNEFRKKAAKIKQILLDLSESPEKIEFLSKSSSQSDIINYFHQVCQDNEIFISEDVIEKMLEAIKLMKEKKQEINFNVLINGIASNEKVLFNTDFIEIYELYGSQMNYQQKLIYKKKTNKSERRIILSTNIAETSLTIPNILYVVDAGLVKIKIGNCLKEQPISKAMANQRAGRAGRIAPGIVIRLYTYESYQLLDQYSTPEVLAIEPIDFIMQVNALNSFSPNKIFSKMLNVSDLNNLLIHYPLPDPIPIEKIKKSLDFLKKFNIIDENDGSLTLKGRMIAFLPLPTIFGLVLIECLINYPECLNEIIIIIAMLTIDKAWFDLNNLTETVIKDRKFIAHPQSDHLSLLYLYLAWTNASNCIKFCDMLKLDNNSFLMTKKIINQLTDIIQGQQEFKANLSMGSISSSYVRVLAGNLEKKKFDQKILKALKTGFSSNIAYKRKVMVDNVEVIYYVNEKEENKMKIHPASVFFLYKTKRPDVLFYSSILETGETYIKEVSYFEEEKNDLLD